MMHYLNTNAINFEFLESLPTLHEGHTSNVKSEADRMRISLTRTGYEHIRQAFIELYNGSEWLTLIEVTQMHNGTEWVDCGNDVL